MDLTSGRADYSATPFPEGFFGDVDPEVKPDTVRGKRAGDSESDLSNVPAALPLGQVRAGIQRARIVGDESCCASYIFLVRHLRHGPMPTVPPGTVVELSVADLRYFRGNLSAPPNSAEYNGFEYSGANLLHLKTQYYFNNHTFLMLIIPETRTAEGGYDAVVIAADKHAYDDLGPSYDTRAATVEQLASAWAAFVGQIPLLARMSCAPNAIRFDKRPSFYDLYLVFNKANAPAPKAAIDWTGLRFPVAQFRPTPEDQSGTTTHPPPHPLLLYMRSYMALCRPHGVLPYLSHELSPVGPSEGGSSRQQDLAGFESD